tara:strand:+ start:57 stop:554 length:498 start_codon:yes stop_codon:yes gene_type:complete
VLIDVPRFTNIRSQEMIKTIIKVMYSAFISIVLFSLVLAIWTSYAFISQSSKSSEIINLIGDMYVSQKSVVIDIIDLSKLLIKNTNQTIASENNKILEEKELPTDLEQKSLLDELSITEDNGDNPLGIVIQPSLPEVSENRLPEMIEEPLVKEQNQFSMSEMEMS